MKIDQTYNFSESYTGSEQITTVTCSSALCSSITGTSTITITSIIITPFGV